MKTKRIGDWITECLSDNEEMTTDEIRMFINSRCRYGTTGRALANVLSKDARFEKVGQVWAQKGVTKYLMSVWSLSLVPIRLSGAATVDMRRFKDAEARDGG